jgi:hypothetical protein
MPSPQYWFSGAAIAAFIAFLAPWRWDARRSKLLLACAASAALTIGGSIALQAQDMTGPDPRFTPGAVRVIPIVPGGKPAPVPQSVPEAPAAPAPAQSPAPAALLAPLIHLCRLPARTGQRRAAATSRPARGATLPAAVPGANARLDPAPTHISQYASPRIPRHMAMATPARHHLAIALPRHGPAYALPTVGCPALNSSTWAAWPAKES